MAITAGIIVQAFDRASAPVRSITNNFQRLRDSIVSANKLMQSAGFASMAAQGVGQFGRSALGAMSAPLSVAGQFEAAMNQVRAVARSSDEDFEKLRATALKLGATTKYSASEAAGGLHKLAMAGWSAQDSIAALPGLMDLATSGGEDLVQVIDIASDIMGSFGLASGEASRVADVFTATITRTNVGVGMLGETMKQVAPFARQLGVSIEETSVLAGLLGDVGIKGSSAGTAMRAMLGSLVAPKGAGKSALAQLGVQIRDAEGNMRKLPAILADISAKTDDMGSAQKAGVLSRIFGREAVASVMALLASADSGRMTSLLGDVTNSAGEAARTAKIMQQGWDNAKRSLASAVEGLVISIGAKLLPAATLVVDALRSVVGWLTQMVERFPTATKAVGLTVLVVGGLATALSSLLMAFAAAMVGLAVMKVGWAGLITTGQVLQGSLIALRTRILAVGASSAATATRGLLVGAAANLRWAATATLQAIPAAGRLAMGFLRVAGAVATTLMPTYSRWTVALARGAGVMAGTATAAISGYIARLGAYVMLLGGRAIAATQVFTASVLRSAVAMGARGVASLVAFNASAGRLVATLVTRVVVGLGGAAVSVVRFGLAVNTGAIPAIVAATKATIAWGLALLATPIGWVLAGIAALVGLGVLVWKNWEPISKFFVAMWDGVKRAVMEYVDYLVGVVRFVVRLFEPLKALVPDWLGGNSTLTVREDRRPFGPARDPLRSPGRASTAYVKVDVESDRGTRVRQLSADGVDLEVGTGQAMGGAW